jgi:tRNA (guanine37-N1)-methyltransferase
VKIWVLTLFPEMFQGPLSTSILKRAKEKGLFDYQLVNFRDFAKDRHRTVDDTPYGGGAGMVLKPEPVFAAVDSIMAQANSCPYRILTTPQGEPFNQRLAKELAAKEELLFICGHYEGYDERIRSLADREISIGDYVLTGGELATMVMIDAIVRLIPGALGDEQSAQNDSFSEGLLDYPQYTKPAVFRGLAVPEILLSGHHARIAAWRRRQALQRTAERRPDLLAKLDLTAEEREMLQQMGYPAPTCEE